MKLAKKGMENAGITTKRSAIKSDGGRAGAKGQRGGSQTPDLVESGQFEADARELVDFGGGGRGSDDGRHGRTQEEAD
jgi:hypothetical protein